MNYDVACKKLDLKKEEITIEILKRQYRLKALMYHPDKNKSPDAACKFQEIHSSYEFLLKNLEFMDYNESDDDVNDDFQKENGSNYNNVLFSFLKNIVNNENKNIYNLILQKLVNVCETKAMESLEKIDKTILLKIYEILNNYSDAFHFSKDFLVKIEELINEKTQNDECIILNPTLDNLFENHVYKLKVNNSIYNVPLWHHELIYDNSGCDLYVKCFPVLPENVTIDNKNNIHVELSYNLNELWSQTKVEILLGKQLLSFFVSDLKMSRKQSIVITKQGISKINTTDIYDISKTSDVILHIVIT
jgi:curved DNA-binding protein CbpA